ncbi:hypothetical protein [Roseisolibacter agri]|uniref:Uncharacterized protein n=1 Tax=Roseisolibacter agri TaxID=2014610 RepID=A0AA37QFH1_9BACT|nr:hypothetical protein [Roseisolibacter agri]GLC27906.1 hypothetical protein rosag_44190 [Roseisolibacter agri]
MTADRDDPSPEGLAPEGLDALLQELRERFDGSADLRAVRVYLAARGYDARRIDTVVSAFAGDPGNGGPAPAARPAGAADPAIGAASAAESADAVPPAPPALRIPAAHERARFSSEAWGHLIQRRAAAGWSVAELEHVIERALVQIDGRIAVDDLRALIDGAFGGSAESSTVH